MKLSAAESERYCRTPDPAMTGALLHGADAGLVAIRRRELVAALLGPEADPLRLTRLEASAIRRDPAMLDEALRSRGFFAGRAVVVVDGATETLAPALAEMLGGLTREDAFAIFTAGPLKAKSELRRLFERARHLAALEVALGAPTADEIDARLSELGLRAGLEDEARRLLVTFAGSLDRSCFDRVLETVAVYSLGATAPLAANEVHQLMPAGLDAEIDAFVDAVAGGQPKRVGPTLRRVVAAGASAVSLLLGLQRHFRGLMIGAGGGRMPLWGARRDAATAQLRGWRQDRLEVAARLLYETDARVRSAERVPALALVERCALRIAIMAER